MSKERNAEVKTFIDLSAHYECDFLSFGVCRQRTWRREVSGLGHVSCQDTDQKHSSENQSRSLGRWRGGGVRPSQWMEVTGDGRCWRCHSGEAGVSSEQICRRFPSKLESAKYGSDHPHFTVLIPTETQYLCLRQSSKPTTLTLQPRCYMADAVGCICVRGSRVGTKFRLINIRIRSKF